MSHLEKALHDQQGTSTSGQPERLDNQKRYANAAATTTVANSEQLDGQESSLNNNFNLSRRSSSSLSSEYQEGYGHVNVSNPLVPEQPVYVSESSGKLRYLGHSSGYAFTQQVLHMLHQYPPSNPSPEIILSLGGEEQRAESGRIVPHSTPDVSRLPSRGIALHYLQCLRFRTEPLFYLFDEPDFVSRLHQFYKDPKEYAQTSLVWFVHYLVLMAFGKALDHHAQRDISNDAAVSELFTRALQLLPDMTYLCDHPVEATELFCSVTLYLYSVNHRQAAAVYVSKKAVMNEILLTLRYRLVKLFGWHICTHSIWTFRRASLEHMPL